MVLLVVTSIAGVFLSTLYQNTLYNYAVRGQNQQELDVRNENVVANGNYSVSGGKVSVIANLTNAGPVTAQIVNLWVFDTSRQTYGFNNSVGNKPWANLSWTTLKAGQVLKFTSNNATKVTVPNATQGDSLSIWFVTARGNTVPLTKSQGITITNIPGTSQGIGSIAMDFKKFSHYDFSSTPGDGTALGNPKFTYTIAAGNSTILHVLLTNFDSSGQSINLTQSSKLWCITPFSGTVKGGDMWGLLNVTGGKVYPSSSKYFLVLQYGKATDVYFGPAGGSGNNKLSSAGNVVPLNILLFGKIGNSDYGQNLPFIALNVLNQ
jgi:hypothetical protein